MVKYAKSSKMLLLFASILFLLSTVYARWLELPNLPWYINIIGFGCFYMTLGHLYKKHEKEILSFEKRFNIFHIFFVFIIILIFKYWSNSNAVTFESSKFVVDAVVITCLGILLVIKFAKLHNYKLFTFIGANSLLFYAMHGKIYSLLQNIAVMLFAKLGIVHTALIDFTLGIGIAISTVIILIIPVLLINKYMPFLAGKGYKLWEAKG